MRMGNKYLKQYKWANIKAMLKNNKANPKECREDFKGKFVIITGATSGIGYATALEYAAHGANLLLINRSEEKSQAVCTEIQTKFGVNCEYWIADFARLTDVHAVLKRLQELDRTIDVLIHNAGICCTEKLFTEDNIELVFQVDFLGSFILTYGLIDKFKSQKTGRILLVNSEGHRFAMGGVYLDDLRWEKHRYSMLKSYGSAKTAQLLALLKFTEIFHESGVTINAMHPGDVKSNLNKNKRARPVEIASKSLYYLGVSPELAGVSGKFFNLTTEEIPAPHALDREVVDELWNLSLKMGQLT
jgi:NAD(P)-dependent dehydrogenase (short-subunit alcohol dehydrogenase family)